MIEINGNKFAKNDSEFTDTLFTGGSTAYGYYKALKNKIIFMDHQRKPFAALVKNPHGSFLVNCSKPDNRYFYQFSLSSTNEGVFGVPSGYADSIEYTNNLVKTYI